MTLTRARAGLLAGGLAAVLTAGLLQLPATAAGTAASTRSEAASASPTLADAVPGLADLDVRDAVTPLADQVAAAAALGRVSVRWNASGTPASILPSDGVLAHTSLSDPVAAARGWLRDHATVFGLDAAQIDALELVNSQKLASSKARAVLLRQRFGTLPPATGGLVTVLVSHGDVVYVSSSLSRTTAEPPAATLTPAAAWLEAAADVRLPGALPDAADITGSLVDGVARLSVPGLAQAQPVRAAALAVPGRGVRPAFVVSVVDVHGGRALAYTVTVDGITGAVLARHNEVENAADAFPFTGTSTGDDCGPRHEFALTDDKTRTISAVLLGAPADDYVLKLYSPGGALLGSGDLLTSPETLTYTATSIPAGTYSVQACPFGPGAVTVGAYQLTVTTGDTAVPSGGAGDALGNPSWRYFDANPSLSSLAGGTVADNTVVGCWTAKEDCDLTLKNVQATAPWDSLTNGVPTLTTIGNNASTHEAWLNALAPGGALQAPVSPTREYPGTAFTDSWNESRCNPAQLVPGGNDIDFAVGNLFASHNRMHDWAYYLGFTEDNYNLQADNLGRGGQGGDPEVGNVQAGAADSQVFEAGGVGTGRNNANQITLMDGTPGITNQYLFQPVAGAFYSPCADGSLDMGIVGHEYTHAISNRMIGGPDDGITSEQGGAMGESWGDLNALEYLFAHGYSTGGNPWAEGVYATGNPDVGIRDYALNRNPLNYSDYGFDSTGPEVHADGEIWNGTQFAVRQALVDQWNSRFPYGDAALQRRCAEATPTSSPLDAASCPGNRRWIQLVFDAFLLQQGATSMLDARDAMIAADQARFDGADTDAMWRAFAQRGMGKDASVASADDTDPVPSFASPRQADSTVTFTAPAGGKVYVGDYEARVTPVADTLSDTPLGTSAPFVAGTYTVQFVSPRTGAVRRTLTVPPGGAPVSVDFGAPVNLAAAANGASVIGAADGSRNADALIDGTEATSWGGVSADPVDVSTPSVAVDLAGGVQTVARVNVSAMLHPAAASSSALPLAADDDPDSGSRFTALRRFALEACLASCSTPGATWTRFYTSPADAFPGVRPRPVAPNLAMRTFDVPDTRAAALRLVALDNQCTGYDGYAGEQDDDPSSSTDCTTASDRALIVHAAELQVFGPAPTTGPVTGPAPGPTTGPTTAPAVTTCRDAGRPVSTPSAHRLRLRAGRPVRATGRAQDDCGVRRVVAALSTEPGHGTACRSLSASGTWVRSRCGARRFVLPVRFDARRGTWSFVSPVRARRGVYLLSVRAIDEAGRSERFDRARTVRIRVVR